MAYRDDSDYEYIFALAAGLAIFAKLGNVKRERIYLMVRPLSSSGSRFAFYGTVDFLAKDIRLKDSHPDWQREINFSRMEEDSKERHLELEYRFNNTHKITISLPKGQDFRDFTMRHTDGNYVARGTLSGTRYVDITDDRDHIKRQFEVSIES